MIKFFRKIRHSLLDESKFKKYFLYAVGELILVVFGILIALSINNKNEIRKDKERMLINIKSIENDIQVDVEKIKKTIISLNKQSEAGNYLIPILESKRPIISDSLTFIMTFNLLPTTPNVTKQNNTFEYLSSLGVLSEFPDLELLKMLQDYYSSLNSIVENYSKTGIPPRMDIRKLKYELFEDKEHRKFHLAKKPIIPNKKVYDSIFSNTRVLPLIRYINTTATYFGSRFSRVQVKAERILNYLDENYD